MKKTRLILCVVLIISSTNLLGQDQSKDVTITSSGSGDTQEKATQIALRSAIEQTFGAFISTRTEILNDELISDQITSVSSGNIKSYEVLNSSQLPDGIWGVIIKSVVSVDKLTSFVQAKGVSVEIKGGMFALNIKQQLLNEQGEFNAVSEMVGLLHEAMQISFDYSIQSGDPKSLDAESKNWEIPLVVTATTNKNIDFCANYLMKTLASLSLSAAEVETYNSLNKKVYPVKVSYNNLKEDYYLRNPSSIGELKVFSRNLKFYTQLFVVSSGIDESFVQGDGNYFEFWRNSDGWNSYEEIINFPSIGQAAGTFSWNDRKTLNQIEQMTEYSVKPRGVVSKIKFGGYVVYEKNGHGLVMSFFDVETGWLNINAAAWDAATAICDNLVLNGYNDWRLPTIEELELIYKNIVKEGKIREEEFKNYQQLYWSSTFASNKAIGMDFYYYFDFIKGQANERYAGDMLLVRAVRTF